MPLTAVRMPCLQEQYDCCCDRSCWQATVRTGGAAHVQEGTTAAPEDSSVMFDAEGSLVTEGSW